MSDGDKNRDGGGRLALPIILFIFFSGFYLLAAQERFFTSDYVINYFTVEALAESHSFILNSGCDTLVNSVRFRDDGQCYSKYDPGLALTSLPLYAIGRLVDGSKNSPLPRLFVSTLNQFVTAATCSVLYLLAVEIGGSRRRALELVILYGLATIAWPYAVSYFSQPLVGLMLLTAVYLLLHSKGNSAYLLGAGAALGWALLVRLDTAPLVLLVVAYAAYRFYLQTTVKIDLLKRFFYLLLPIALSVVLYLIINQSRSGYLLQYGYEGEGWTGVFSEGVYGLLFSPGRGLLFYSPLSILAMFGLFHLWREEWHAEVILIISLFLTQLVMYSFWFVWTGGWSWGPRFLISTQPLLILGLLPLLNHSRYKVLLFVIMPISFYVQLVGTATSVNMYLFRTEHYDKYTYAETLYKPIASPIWGQTIDLLNRRISLLLTSQAEGSLSRRQTIAWAFISIGLMVAGGIGLLRTMKSDEML